MDIDLTFLIQLGIFLTLVGVLTPILFRPFQRVLSEREKKTTQLRTEASRLEALAGEDRSSYESRLDEARHAAARERDALRAEGKDEERTIIQGARDEVMETLGEARAELVTEETTVRNELATQRDALAVQLVEKILGRKLA